MAIFSKSNQILPSTHKYTVNMHSLQPWTSDYSECSSQVVEGGNKLREVVEVRRMKMDQQKQVILIVTFQALWPKTKGNCQVNKLTSQTVQNYSLLEFFEVPGSVSLTACFWRRDQDNEIQLALYPCQDIFVFQYL